MDALAAVCSPNVGNISLPPIQAGGRNCSPKSYLRSLRFMGRVVHGDIRCAISDSSSSEAIPVNSCTKPPACSVPLLSSREVIDGLKENQWNRKSKQQFLAMYSSIFGGITTDPAVMVIPMDDHMVHRGHGVFDTATIVDGEPALYAIVIQDQSSPNYGGIKVITATTPIKSPQFATMKSVNYLPNVLSKMEAEDQGAFASIWLDDEGFVAEGPNMNVAFVTEGKVLLMPRFDKILSGCTAKRILVLAEKLVKDGKLKGIKVANVTVEEGKAASEMMLIGSGTLVRPVIQWDEQVIGNGEGGPIASALLDLLLDDMKISPTSIRIPVPY
ncbi:unnamed protein product [Victoria cruziana]